MKLYWLLTALLSVTAVGQGNFDWVSFNMVKRTVANGKVTRVESNVYYKSTGEMVTHFDSPLEMYVLNNELGDVRLYNPESNTVIKTLDNRVGSQNTTFYYFLVGKTDDLGLESAGFTLMDSKIEDMMLITLWDAPAEVKNHMDRVELVNNGDVPVFMGYLDKKGNYIKKIYYYKFENVGNYQFPMAITEIDFIKQDSLITKSSFGSFVFNNDKDLSMLNFKIPENARLVE